MAWTIELSEEAEATLCKLDKPIRQRVGRFIDRVASLPNPRMQGEALQGPLAGLWRYRVGDYRLVCHLRDDTLVVLVVWLGHRREVYR
ncbi:type II toxin-antitoxin system RelE/ParE family toxin [uncultured Fretibacterium sp.]|uniref:type II toxin-antitoxin system RelE family toxin n=1 Tax=uncultured Fretibacterium sp. TaxID=1678694 RepID=UPI00261F8133|nr:type II toxin-antitoxin system RelE/ParE family toxin [uncultured Fretibacterium sp.]